jgi:hypothetical protein
LGPLQTRLKMFWTSVALLKIAEPPVGTENWLKLWKRLLPDRIPLLIVKLFPAAFTVVPIVPSGTTCAITPLGNPIDTNTTNPTIDCDRFIMPDPNDDV